MHAPATLLPTLSTAYSESLVTLGLPSMAVPLHCPTACRARVGLRLLFFAGGGGGQAIPPPDLIYSCPHTRRAPAVLCLPCLSRLGHQRRGWELGTMLEAVFRLKACGNAEFSKNNEAGYRQACVIYGQVLQCMIALERGCPPEPPHQAEDDAGTDDASASSGTTTTALCHDFLMLKPTIFLNLAAANLHLGAGGLEGCHRCCNAAVVFINNPHLLLDELGQDDDSDVAATAEIRLLEPVAPQCEALATKALYRRGRCLVQMGAPFLDRARRDLETALRLSRAASTQHLEIQRALQSIDKQVWTENNFGSNLYAATGTTASAVSEGDDNSNSGDYLGGTLDDVKSVASAVSHISGVEMKRRSVKACKAQQGARKSFSPEPPLPSAILAGMQINGGMCLRRGGLWSQSMGEASVYFSLAELLLRREKSQDGGGGGIGDEKVDEEAEEVEGRPDADGAPGWSVSFSVDTITVSFRGQPLLHALLEYNIRQAECLWTLEAFGAATTAPSHLVLYLQKAPSVEWFPGCEWWDRVFIDDEPIDTSTCCLPPSDMDKLPQQARDRAQQHVDGFARLDPAQRGAELDLLSHAKKELFDAAQALQDDERSNNDANPGREEMLDALRAEFPSIFFGSK